MSWAPEIKTKALIESVASLVERAEGLFDDQIGRQRDMESRLAEVLSEPDVMEILIGRIARNACGYPVKY